MVESDPIFFEVLKKPYKILLRLAFAFPQTYAFQTSYIPWFILHRVNEYVHVPFMLIMAFEGFVMVMKPFGVRRLFTDERRKID